MRRRALSSASLLVLMSISLMVTGCGKTTTVCPAATGTCGCGVSSSSACPANFLQLLYATTSTNQVLAFSIDPSSGSLTALPASAGPTNSDSIAVVPNAVMFADSSSNAVDAVSVNQVTGVLTPISGSPFSLGSPNGGPTSIAVGPYNYLYATEPDGTIVGFGTSAVVGAIGMPLPGSPYPAGIAPSQMAFVAQGTGTFFLCASDPGDPNGGILAYSLDSTGALTPVAGSPFPTLANANPSSVLAANYTPASGAQGTEFLLVSLSSIAKIAVFSVDTNTGSLTAVPGSPFAVGNVPGAMLEDDFNHIFVMNGGDHTVSALNLGSNGSLTPIGTPVPVGTANAGMAYYPWNQLYVADTASSAIWTLNIDHTTGTLTQAGASLAVSSPPLQLIYVGP